MAFQSGSKLPNNGPRGWSSSGSSFRRDWRSYTSPTVQKPLGSLIESIDIDSLIVPKDALKIENVEYLSSYNWLDGRSPIILVPGSPPAWTPPATDSKLNPDSGDHFRDLNAARYPSFPTEPAVRSIFALRPEYGPIAVDIMACGSTMGNLVSVARKMAKPFKFDVDVVGETVFFVRRENSPTEVIENLKGYGHTFPEAYTTWDEEVRNSCSHQRIIEYDFGDLHFLIRSEADGYLREEPSASKEKDNKSTSVDEILSNMTVASVMPSSDQKLVVRMQGAEVPQDRIFDIKTRSNYTTFDMEDIIPRLWINQTRKFLLAYHLYGRFDKPQVADVETNILNWQKENSAALGRFYALIRRIIDAVIDAKEQQVEVSWVGEGPLEITKQIGPPRRALPPDLLQTWRMY